MGTNSELTVGAGLGAAIAAALTNACSAEEIQRRSTPDADGLLPSDHVMQAIKEHLSRVPGITCYEV